MSAPSQRAVVCRRTGDPAIARVECCPIPRVEPGQVRIRVESAGVSFATGLVLQGKHQNTPATPFTPGTELAGVVLECGAGVERFRPGDRVLAGTRSGAWAQQVAVPERSVFHLPEGVGFDAATHFPTIYATAYAALNWRARARPGEWLLVHGAAGGSGLAAIGVGKCLGLRVIATASTAEKRALASAHGADHVLGAEAAELRDAVLSLTGGAGVDLVYDPVGGALFNESLRCVAAEARLIPMGFASGTIPSIPANLVLVKNVDVIGIYWGYYFGWGRAEPPAGNDARLRAAFAELLGWCEQGLLQPLTSGCFALDEFGEALARVAGRQVTGRLVLHPQSS